MTLKKEKLYFFYLVLVANVVWLTRVHFKAPETDVDFCKLSLTTIKWLLFIKYSTVVQVNLNSYIC